MKRAKQKGISSVGVNGTASSSHSSVGVTTSTVDTEAAKVSLPNTANRQDTSTCKKAKSAQMLQCLFPFQNPVYVDNILGEKPHTPKTSTQQKTLL